MRERQLKAEIERLKRQQIAVGAAQVAAGQIPPTLPHRHDAAILTYAPADVSDWGGSDPGNVDDALDWLAGTLDGIGVPDASIVTYTPGVLADWDGSADPGNTEDALDQLAERVTDLEAGGPGSLTALYDIPADTDTLTGINILLDYGSANALSYTIGESSGGAGDTGFSGLVMQPVLDFTHDTLSAAAFSYGVLWDPVIKGTGGIDFDQSAGFVDDTRFITQGTDTYVAHYSFVSHPSFTRTSGSLTMTNFYGFASLGWRDLETSQAITTYRHFYAGPGVSGAGSIGTVIAFDIAAQLEGTTKIGIRTAEDIRLISGADLNIWDDGLIRMYTDSGSTQTGQWDANSGFLSIYSTGTLRLYSDAGSTLTGLWDASSGQFSLLGAAKTFTSVPILINHTSTVTVNMSAGLSQFIAYNSSATIQTQNNGGLSAFFNHVNTYKNVSGSAATPMIPLVFYDGGTLQSDGENLTTVGWVSFWSNPSTSLINGAGGDQLTASLIYGYRSSLTVGATTTATTRYGFIVHEATGSGAVGTQYGLYIEALSKGSTANVGIYNLSNSRQVGYARFGSSSAPTNVTDGDLTVTRLNVGNVAFGTGVESVLGGDATLSGFLRVGSNTAPANTAAGDLTIEQLIVGHNAASTLAAWIHETSLGSPVLRLSSTATNDDPAKDFQQNRLETTSNVTTTIHTVAIAAGVTFIEAIIEGRRTAGAGGGSNQCGVYRLMAGYKNIGGTVSIIGAITTDHSGEDDANWNATFTISGTNVLVQVLGGNAQTVSWHAHVTTYGPVNS